MNAPQIVVDTNVLIAALRSRRGAAYRLLMLVGRGLFDVNLSVSLFAEYEAVAKRMLDQTALTEQELEEILDYLCAVSNKRSVFYLWRPFLQDPGDAGQSHLNWVKASKCFRIPLQVGVRHRNVQE